MATSRQKRSREAIEQGLRKWESFGRDERIKLAKAYLIDAVQQMADEATHFSPRVETGIKMLSDALSTPKGVALGPTTIGALRGLLAALPDDTSVHANAAHGVTVLRFNETIEATLDSAS